MRVKGCNPVKNVKQNIVKHPLRLVAQNYLESDSKSQWLRLTPDKSSKIRLAERKKKCSATRVLAQAVQDLTWPSDTSLLQPPRSNKARTFEGLDLFIKLVIVTSLWNTCSGVWGFLGVRRGCWSFAGGGVLPFYCWGKGGTDKWWEKVCSAESRGGSSASQNGLLRVPRSHWPLLNPVPEEALP